MFIELKKAFDTVKHSILPEKLEIVEARDHMREPLKSYLTDKQQCVRSGVLRSSILKLDYVVPILGVDYGVIKVHFGPISFDSQKRHYRLLCSHHSN